MWFDTSTSTAAERNFFCSLAAQAKNNMAPKMDPKIWHKVAAISGIAALGLGTYGARGFRPQKESYKEVWCIASLYRLVHTAALVGAPITKHPNIFGGLLTTGFLAFSGSCLMLLYLFMETLFAKQSISTSMHQKRDYRFRDKL